MELLERPCGPGHDTGSEWSESRAGSGPDSPECPTLHPALHPALHPYSHLPHTPGPPKPRIWSLADMASKDEPPSSPFGPGKMMRPGGIPLAVPYPRPPHDFYRSLHGPPHLSSNEGVSLLESYNRTFGGAHPPTSFASPLSSVLSKVAAAAAASSGNSFTHNVAAGASSASSTESSTSDKPPRP